ncbi:MAG TPA: UDP-N-acetylglucosamine--N-acetylmuramyl-(pentapeptide) pyrophosphoryl-undecaprenol N-acetylglucosamine transferase [Candidatus Paceibacterota bacterium]|nr:UDP-N-acetylglucosamine--N-acetylmuramyl-(pentapeptide) pyrophosphoryl-undecaprenol N-acetylglucosamine transferase [Candidatus Paceibacterota bacterium]
MRILFTGGGTGGHLYPIIAIIQAIRDIEREENLIDVQLFYAGDAPYSKQFFYDNEVQIKKINTGKRRQYFSILNFFDIFKTFFAFLDAFWYLYNLYPDVVFGKGGAVSFPVLLSAKLLQIPVMIHESDSAPGRTNLWAAKFAKSIAISYPEAANDFPKEKTVLTGNPVRKEMLNPVTEGAREFLKLEESTPIITVLGGSQGSQVINSTIFGALPELLERYQIIHQVGEKNIKLVESILEGILTGNDHRYRYKYFGHLNDLAMKMSAGVSELVISRAGSTIFEIAVWKKPSIIIPIHHSNGDHQMKNAYYYARSGAAVVIEEENLTPHVLVAEIDRIMQHPDLKEKMSQAAGAFADTTAAEKIGRQLIKLAFHEEQKKNPKEESKEEKKEK